MHIKHAAALIFACLLLANAALCADKEEPTSPEALIARARSQGEIWIDGAPPMLMRADLEVLDPKSVLVHGDYTLNWVSPSQWREEIRFGNYERIRVRETKGYWQKSALTYQPEIIFQLDTLLHLKEALRVASRLTLGKVKNRDKAGVRQRCLEVKWTKSTERVMCFDETTGTLISIEYPRGENQNPPEITRIEYGAFNAVGGKLIPYEIRALREQKTVAAIKVLEISRRTGENPALFNVPVNAEFWAQCDDMQEVELLDRVQPTYPDSSRINHEQGRVILYAVIEVDGSVSHMAIIHRATPAFEAATIETVGHWHFKPASCGQTPIRLETSIATDFWLKN
jgi:hypothetical protein